MTSPPSGSGLDAPPRFAPGSSPGHQILWPFAYEKSRERSGEEVITTHLPSQILSFAPISHVFKRNGKMMEAVAEHPGDLERMLSLQ